MNERLRTSAAVALVLSVLGIPAAARPAPKASPPASTIRGNVDVARKIENGKVLELLGWAADFKTGPVQKVEIRLNEKPIGLAQIGMARPDVAQTFRRNDFLKSGWTAKLDLSKLPAGAYRASVYAFSGGASAPLAMGKVEFRLP